MPPLPPAFIITAVVCAAPFALAIRDDLTADSSDGRHGRDRYDDDNDLGYDEDALEKYAAEQIALQRAREAAAPKPITPGDLDTLFGAAPATPGPLLAGAEVGAYGVDDVVRSRLDRYQDGHQVTVDHSIPLMTVESVTVRAQGDETALRAAMIQRWGEPYRIGDGELVWLGDGGQRAGYSAMADGMLVTFTPYQTVEAFVAAGDRKKLGVEPFPLLGAELEELETVRRLEATSYGSDEWYWTEPGVGAGTGRTTLTVTTDDDGTILSVTIEGNTIDGSLRDALIAKWGAPAADDDGDSNLNWKRGRKLTKSVEIDGTGFTIRLYK